MDPFTFDKEAIHALIMFIANEINDHCYLKVEGQPYEIHACYPAVNAHRFHIILDERRFEIEIIADGPT